MTEVFSQTTVSDFRQKSRLHAPVSLLLGFPPRKSERSKQRSSRKITLRLEVATQEVVPLWFMSFSPSAGGRRIQSTLQVFCAGIAAREHLGSVADARQLRGDCEESE